MRLRLMGLEDARIVWEWSQDPEVLAAAFDPAPVTWERHLDWVTGRLQDDRSLMTILETDAGEPTGQLRFDVVADGLEIDFSIAAPYRGRGYGAQLLQEALALARTRWPAGTTVIARVLASNARSLAVCRRAGFHITEYGHDNGRSYARFQRPLAERSPSGGTRPEPGGSGTSRRPRWSALRSAGRGGRPAERPSAL